jgi:hypothetical protein
VAAQAMPGRVRRVLIGAVAIAMVGALYLIVQRGEALLIDLALLRSFCF